MKPIRREAIIDRRQPHMRWSAVLAGGTLAIGLWVLLQTIGMGIGLVAVDTDDGGNLRGVGIGTGVWSLIAPLIAMFVGALLAGRLAGTREARVGAMHGSVLWALTSAVGVFAIVSILSMIASGITRAGSAAAGATSSVISSAIEAGSDADILSKLGVDDNDLLGPVNQKLREQGKPAITATQLRNSINGAAQRGLRKGRIDRDMLAQELAQNTALSRADVDDLAGQIADRYHSVASQARETASDLADSAKDVALNAADKTGKAMLMFGLTFLLALGAALGGGALGARLAARELGPDARSTVPPPGAVPRRDDDDRFVNVP